jgi:class 3 adenylate cyclase
VRVVEVPETRYATTSSGDDVAFQVVGDGPIDVLVNRIPLFPIDLMWDEPRLVHFLNRLSSFCRHIWFDPRGTGASERVGRVEGRLAETLIEDMVAVLDAANCQRAVVLQLGGFGMSLLFGATHPQRTSALVLVNSFAWFEDDDASDGLSGEVVDRQVTHAEVLDAFVAYTAPSVVDDAHFRRWFDRAYRLICPPHDHWWRRQSAAATDLSWVIGSVQAPTLVACRRDLDIAPQSRYLADHIDRAEYVELDGRDRLPFVGDADGLLDAIERFVTGKLPPARADRVLATVLFTDLVSSTPQVAEMGDRRWRNLIATHDALVRAELDRYRGREVRFDGDGVLATFDGPERAIRCACAIRDALGALGLEVRAGLHTGEIELRSDDVAGIAVHIGKRVSSQAGPGEVLVSRTVADLIAGSDIELRDRGEHELKGVPGSWRLFSVRD